jgi:hypothetical protein
MKAVALFGLSVLFAATVWAQSKSVNTYSVSGEVVQGATVEISSRSFGTATTVSGANGTYIFTGIPPGTYALRASKPECSFGGPRTVTVTNANVTGVTFPGMCTAHKVPDPNRKK